MHRDGKVRHPRGRSPNPINGTDCVVLSDVRDSTEFCFGDLDGKEISPNHVQLQNSDRCTYRSLEIIRNFPHLFSREHARKTLKIFPNNTLILLLASLN